MLRTKELLLKKLFIFQLNTFFVLVVFAWSRQWMGLPDCLQRIRDSVETAMLASSTIELKQKTVADLLQPARYTIFI